MTRQYRKTEDFIGLRFDKVTVLSFAGYGPSVSNRHFLCRCDCGNEVLLWDTSFYRQHVSCKPCRNARTGRNGQSRHPLHSTWKNVRDRVPQWKDFQDFVRAVGDRPAPLMTVSMRDKSQPLSVENWKWTSVTELSNAATSQNITIFGVTKNKSGWAGICSITKERMRQRFDKYEPESAVLVYDSAIRFFKERGMAEVVEQWPGSDLDKYFDGRIWRLDKGTDFTDDIGKFRMRLAAHARCRGKKAETRVLGDSLFVRCVSIKAKSNGKKVKRVSKSA